MKTRSYVQMNLRCFPLPGACSASCVHVQSACRQDAKFQEGYQLLRRGAQHNNNNHASMVLLTFEVQQKVLPKFGFEASPKGVMEMRWETGLHADMGGANMSCRGDKVVARLRRDIHLCLDMDVNKADRLPIFHTVGDSHSCFGWPKFVIQHWQGPLLGFNVHRVDLRKLTPPLREGDAVILCFGEIDCRCHVHKQRYKDLQGKDPRPYQEVIDDIISRYVSHLRTQTRPGNLPAGVKIFVFNVPPPARGCDVAEVPEFPFIGEDSDRKNYVLHFVCKYDVQCEKGC